MSKTAKTIIALGIVLLTVVLLLEFQPCIAWPVARLGAAILAAICGVLTTFGTDYKGAVSEIKQEHDIFKQPKRESGIWAKYGLAIWIIGWIVVSQVMVSFYIADMQCF